MVLQTKVDPVELRAGIKRGQDGYKISLHRDTLESLFRRSLRIAEETDIQFRDAMLRAINTSSTPVPGQRRSAYMAALWAMKRCRERRSAKPPEPIQSTGNVSRRPEQLRFDLS